MNPETKANNPIPNLNQNQNPNLNKAQANININMDMVININQDMATDTNPEIAIATDMNTNTDTINMAKNVIMKEMIKVRLKPRQQINNQHKTIEEPNEPTEITSKKKKT